MGKTAATHAPKRKRGSLLSTLLGRWQNPLMEDSNGKNQKGFSSSLRHGSAKSAETRRSMHRTIAAVRAHSVRTTNENRQVTRTQDIFSDYKISNWSPSYTMTLCIRDIVRKSEACITAQGICTITRLWVMLVSDAFRKFDRYILNFKYLEGKNPLE